jgi:hypothetical protein
MALPTFFIIGAAKAGTTSLHYYLDLHPEIQMSAVKETHFFAGPAEGRPYELGRVETLEEYEALFDPTVPVRGEASPSYTSYPFREGVPARIKELVPEAKFVYLVRDPVERTISHYQHRVSVGGERRSLPEVLGECSDPLRLRETCMSFYASQLDNYLRLFPSERILVVDQAELLADRDAVLREIFDFLGVEPTFTSAEFGAELLKTSERRRYPVGYNYFVRRVAAPSLRRLPASMRRSLRSRVEKRLFPPLPEPALDDDLRTRLESLFSGEIERLRALTDKEFATWSV